MINALTEGKENAVRSVDLQRIFETPNGPGGGRRWDDVAIRDLIRSLIVNHHVPIAGGGSGFYIVKTHVEVREYLANLIGRIYELENRLKHFERACTEADIMDDQLRVF